MFIMSFLIPQELTENAPYPLDAELFLEKDPPSRYTIKTEPYTKMRVICIISAILLSTQVIETFATCMRRGVECVEYQVIGRFQGYEERQYPATTWISTTMESSSLTEANREMYKKLFSYIQGNNARGVKVNTTTPVRTRIVPCHGATCATMFIMSFLIPQELTENAPYPLDAELFLEKDPPSRYAVKMFDGRPTEADWLEESHKLADLLRKDPGIDKSHYYTSFYDPPYQLFHRMNEIWMSRKNPKENSNTSNASQTLPLLEATEHKSDIRA